MILLTEEHLEQTDLCTYFHSIINLRNTKNRMKHNSTRRCASLDNHFGSSLKRLRSETYIPPPQYAMER